MHCMAVRVRAEFDIDIQHHWCWLRHWCWLKWCDSLHCSLMPVVEPRECSERAYAYDHGRATQPRIKVDILIEPPKQHSTPNAEPDAGPGEIADAQMGDRLEPRPDGEAKGEPEEQHHGNENRSYETHCFTDTEYCTTDTRRRCRSTCCRNRPRLRPRAASAAQRPRLEASLSSDRPEPKPRDGRLRDIEQPRYIGLRFAVGKALESFSPLVWC